MRFSKMLLVALLSMPLCGCLSNYVSVDQSKVSTQNLPHNYRKIIAQELRSRLFDPYSVREAAISRPTWGVMSPAYGERLFFCIRYNAKNRFGGYIGTKFYNFGWNIDNKLFGGDILFWEDDALCPKVDVKPFPELGDPN